jgi:probable rRNA maturation factor
MTPQPAQQQAGRVLTLGQRLLRVDQKACVSAARRVFRALQAGGLDVGLTFVHDLEMRALNRAWRKLDEPTDVLSFPLDEDGLLGDLVISVDTARRQARALGHALDTEIAVLVAHGLVHLAGLDHARSDDELHVQQACEETLLACARVDVAAGLIGR